MCVFLQLLVKLIWNNITNTMVCMRKGWVKTGPGMAVLHKQNYTKNDYFLSFSSLFLLLFFFFFSSSFFLFPRLFSFLTGTNFGMTVVFLPYTVLFSCGLQCLMCMPLLSLFFFFFFIFILFLFLLLLQKPK